MSIGYVSFGWIGENRSIKVIIKDGLWHTEHLIDGKPDEHLIKVFGANILPTPWSEEVDQETVIKELKERNLHAEIS